MHQVVVLGGQYFKLLSWVVNIVKQLIDTNPSEELGVHRISR